MAGNEQHVTHLQPHRLLLGTLNPQPSRCSAPEANAPLDGRGLCIVVPSPQILALKEAVVADPCSSSYPEQDEC